MSITSKKLLSLRNDEIKETYKKIEVENKKELLLLEAPSEIDPVFRALNAPSQKDFINVETETANAITHYETLYGKTNPSFKGYHIKKMCNTYFLQIQLVSSLKSYLSKESMAAVKAFTETFDKALTGNSIFIMCPREYFSEKGYGKPCKHFILFYMDPKDSRNSDYHLVEEGSMLTQFYSEGSDFKSSRKLIKYFSSKKYEKHSSSKLSGHFTSLFKLLVPCLLSFNYGYNKVSIAFFLLFVFSVIANVGSNFSSDKYWRGDTFN